jgi:hypothetical protein
MQPASRTPEGEPNQCPICGKEVQLEPSRPPGDAPCPNCGHLLWFDSPSSSAVTLNRHEHAVLDWTRQLTRCPDEYYFKELFSGLAKFAGTRRGAAWIVVGSSLKRVFQHEDVEFPETPAERQRSNDLLRRVAASGQSLVSRPSAEAELRGDRPQRNSCVLLAVPVKWRGQIATIIEIAEEPGGTAELHRNLLQLLEMICEIASERIGRLAERQTLPDADLVLETEAVPEELAAASSDATIGKKHWWQVWKK